MDKHTNTIAEVTERFPALRDPAINAYLEHALALDACDDCWRGQRLDGSGVHFYAIIDKEAGRWRSTTLPVST